MIQLDLRWATSIHDILADEATETWYFTPQDILGMAEDVAKELRLTPDDIERLYYGSAYNIAMNIVDEIEDTRSSWTDYMSIIVAMSIAFDNFLEI